VSEHLAKYVTHKRSSSRPRGDDESSLPADEAKALSRIRSEAASAGATLANGGKGGLPPSMVLGIFRRDGFQCKKCGGRENVSIHHKGGVVMSQWLSKKGHKLDRNNLVTICNRCHDKIHTEARAEGVDSSQVKPEGDR
jgi:hypothetical protein